MTNSQNFLIAAAQILDQQNVLSTNEELRNYEKNVSGFKKKVAGIVFPENKEHVQLIIKLANQYKTSLYPISTGKNWGLGSRLPITDGCVVVDLSKMKQIRHVDTEFGYAFIEPGVTQQQLSNFLIANNIPYFLDITGSGAHTSVIGNSLERGVSYSSMRVEKTLRLEVVLGNGDIITTGFGHYSDSTLSHLYRYGIGPSLDGLFYESNFGIVTALTVALMPMGEENLSYTIGIDNEENIPIIINKLRTLYREGIITGVPHLFNKLRLHTALVPLLYDHYLDHNMNVPVGKIESMANQFFPQKWILAGSMSGRKSIVKIARKIIKKEFSSHGKVSAFDKRTFKWMSKIVRYLGTQNQKTLLSVMTPLQGASEGIPVDSTLKSVHWAAFKDKGYRERPIDIDSGNAGVLYSSPLCPLSGKHAQDFISLTQNICHSFGFSPGIAINTMSANLLEGVISIHFNKLDINETEKAHQCLRRLNERYMEQGFYLYRADINSMDLICNPQSTHWQIIKALKQTFDPNHLLSPQRYNIV